MAKTTVHLVVNIHIFAELRCLRWSLSFVVRAASRREVRQATPFILACKSHPYSSSSSKYNPLLSVGLAWRYISVIATEL
ncbi:MAG: hypothetical protein ACYT04_85085, partial [Nostoc sp.]